MASCCLVLVFFLPVDASEPSQVEGCNQIQENCKLVMNFMEKKINKLADNLLRSMVRYERLVDVDSPELNGSCFVSFTLTQLINSTSSLMDSFAQGSENFNLTRFLKKKLQSFKECQSLIKQECPTTAQNVTMVTQCVGYFFEYFQSVLNRYRRIFQDLCLDGESERPTQSTASALFKSLKGDCITVLQNSAQSAVLSATAGSARNGDGSSDDSHKCRAETHCLTQTPSINGEKGPETPSAPSVTQTHPGGGQADSYRDKHTAYLPSALGMLAVALLISFILNVHYYRQNKRLEQQYHATPREEESSTIQFQDDGL